MRLTCKLSKGESSRTTRKPSVRVNCKSPLYPPFLRPKVPRFLAGGAGSIAFRIPLTKGDKGGFGFLVPNSFAVFAQPRPFCV